MKMMIIIFTVTRPRIIHFSNTKVNPGQPSTFNCTVASFPTPLENELRLMAPIGKRVTLLQSIVFENNIYTRSSLFQVFHTFIIYRYNFKLQIETRCKILLGESENLFSKPKSSMHRLVKSLSQWKHFTY